MFTSMDLSGCWRFSFEKPDYNDTIKLPGTTALAGKGGSASEPCIGYLTERYPYTGKAYFKKTITFPAKYAGMRCCLFLERTRMSKLYINGTPMGEGNSLTTPHRYFFTLPNTLAETAANTSSSDNKAIAEINDECSLCIEIEVANTGYPVPGGHMTSPDTQTNWLGIMGRIELQIFNDIYIDKAATRYLADTDSLQCHLSIINNTTEPIDTALTIRPEIIKLQELIQTDRKNYEIPAQDMTISRNPRETYNEKIHLNTGVNQITFELNRGSLPLWSEHNPSVVQLHFELGNRVCENHKGNSHEAHNNELERNDYYVCFAKLCSLTTTEHDFVINGTPVKLRGKHDGLLFPLTGAAPMDVHEWLKVMGTALRYGINHYRYHTCCPPEAAFTAADLLGIIMEPELPFWGTVADKDEEGYNEAQQGYLMGEARSIMTEYGNHPSFGMLSLGNELWGSKKRVSEILCTLKGFDNRFLFTQGSNNFQFVPEVVPGEDFFVAARLAPPVNGQNKHLIRGSFATCNAPLGVIQTQAPSTKYNFDVAILDDDADNISQNNSATDNFLQDNNAKDNNTKDNNLCDNIISKNINTIENNTTNTAADNSEESGIIAIQYGTGVKYVRANKSNGKVAAVLPIVSHEIGQYCMYPDFDEIERYTGVLYAGNLEIFKNKEKAAGMEKDFGRFFKSSGTFAVNCYREELEMMHRSHYMAGYQLLDLQDYTGQNTSLVGVLNSFMESKGLIDEKSWRRFCSDEVLSVSFDGYIYEDGNTFNAQIILSHFNPLMNFEGKELMCELFYTDSTKEAASVTTQSENNAPVTESSVTKTESNTTETVSCAAKAVSSTVKSEGYTILTGKKLTMNSLSCGTHTLMNFSCDLAVRESRQLTGERLILRAGISGTDISQEYTLYLYSCKAVIDAVQIRLLHSDTAPLITSDANEAWNSLDKGGCVLLFPSKVNEYIPGFYCTDFWNYPMFRQISIRTNEEIAVGTLGLCIEDKHPALALFDSEMYSTPQWYNIVSCGKGVILDGEPFEPIVQIIDNTDRCHRLGLIFEACTDNGGRLMVCSADYDKLNTCPEGRQLSLSLLSCMVEGQMKPATHITKEYFSKLFQ